MEYADSGGAVQTGRVIRNASCAAYIVGSILRGNPPLPSDPALIVPTGWRPLIALDVARPNGVDDGTWLSAQRKGGRSASPGDSSRGVRAGFSK